MSAGNVKTGAIGSTTAALLNSIPSAAEKNKQWQRELLMERIRTRSTQHKSFQELSKTMRMSMLDKRYALDDVEKANLQKCLDSMQHCIKVTSRQGLIERLESLTRQLGLKFTAVQGTSLFISTDMFYLEIILDANGVPTEVKVYHECKIEQPSCSELVNSLKRGDFADFTAQLEGLSSIYQLNAEPKMKATAFVALQAMETDLYNLFQMQNFNKDNLQLVKESMVGLVLKRRGGHPMKLTYFVSPYDLISVETKSLQALTTDLITSKDVGFSVTLNLEASAANKLQILPTVTGGKDAQTGAEVPVYAPLTQMNSMLLPATFVLRLNKPLPVCHATLRALGVSSEATGMDAQSQKPPVVSTIMNLVVQTASEGQLKNSQKGLFVCLPDQTHCYFFTENKQMQATLVSSVPFTEPAQVPKILDFLKKHALFYTLLASCVRTQSRMGNDMESTTILEVNAISFHQISVSLQHSFEESMATVEFELSGGNVKCSIYSLNQNYEALSQKLTKIVEKCLSIPVTVRALLNHWHDEYMKTFTQSLGGVGASGSGGGGGGGGTNMTGVNASGSGGGFGNFNLAMGDTASGSCVGGGSARVGGIKMEPSARPIVPSTSAAASAVPVNVSGGGNVAGYLKYKNDVKMETDFHESPKSQMQMSSSSALLQSSVELSSLGQQSPMPPHEQQPQQTRFTDAEIADKYKNIWKDKTPNLKNCVSITPISQQENKAMQQSVDVKRTGGIEIIPLTGQQSNSTSTTSNMTTTSTNNNTNSGQPGPSTITITPINSNAGGGKEKKSSNSSLGGSTSGTMKRTLDAMNPNVAADAPKEKKRKKKRDDSPMGPPEKVYSRQNSPAHQNNEAGTAITARKFPSPASSPKSNSGGSNTLTTTRPSPKHSPAYSSPKHNTASNSPKSPFGTHSPKHGSSGKPSMSTLKSAAATSLSPKADKSGNGGMSGVLPALSSTAAAAANVVKTNLNVAGMQQMKTAINHGTSTTGGAVFGANVNNISNVDLNASSAMIRKVNAGAVSLMSGSSIATATVTTTTTPSMTNDMSHVSAAPQAQQRLQATLHQQQPSAGSSENCPTIGPSSSDGGYMVKSSQEGLKLTINKTTTKSHTGTNMKSNKSPTNMTTKKQHTGLKPGVNSGPASKKLPAGGNSITSPPKSNNTTTKHTFQKSNSSGNLSTKLSNSSGAASSGVHSGCGLTKSASANSFGDLNALRKVNKKSNERGSSSSVSQPPARMDHNRDMMTILQYASPLMAANMEGFMKGLNSKFHIPKLSQRAANASTGAQNSGSAPQSTSAPATPLNYSPPVLASNNSAHMINTTNATTGGYGGGASNVSITGEHFNQITNQSGLSQAAAAQQRSPPPPYHAAVAANNSGSPLELMNSKNSSSNSDMKSITAPSQQSSVSVRILKSPVPSPLVSAGAGSMSAHGQQQQQQQQQLLSGVQQQQHSQAQTVDFLTKAANVAATGAATTTTTMEEVFVSATGLATSK